MAMNRYPALDARSREAHCASLRRSNSACGNPGKRNWISDSAGMTGALFNLNKDPIIIILLILIHSLAVLVLWIAIDSVWISIIGTCLLALSCTYYVLRYGLKKTDNSIIAFQFDPRAGAHCLTRRGRHPVAIHWRSVITYWLLALDCMDRTCGRRYKVLIWAWQHPPGTYRILMKQLKITKTTLHSP